MPDPKPTRLNPRKIYLKDASFESPLTPNVFLSESLKPDIEMNIDLQSKQVDDGGQFFEVVLHVTATAKQDDKTMFLVEVHQAGLFEINADDDAHKQLLIHVGCGHMLLPFAREEVASLVAKGGFPQLLMAPINFESIYRQRVEAAQKSQEDGETNDQNDDQANGENKDETSGSNNAGPAPEVH